MQTNIKHINTSDLQAANLVIGQFITSCSHSFRGPLKSIVGLVNLLQIDRYDTPLNTGIILGLIDSTVDKMEHTLVELEHFLEN